MDCFTQNLGSIQLIFAAYLNLIGADFHEYPEPKQLEMVKLAIKATKDELGITNNSNSPKDLAAIVKHIEPSFKKNYVETISWDGEEGFEFKDELSSYQTKPTYYDRFFARSEKIKEEALEKASKLSSTLRPYLNQQHREKEALKKDLSIWENTEDDTTREIDSFWEQQ